MSAELKRANELRQMRDSTPQIVEGFKVLANLHMARYKALIDAGFTEDQAFQLTLKLA